MSDAKVAGRPAHRPVGVSPGVRREGGGASVLTLAVMGTVLSVLTTGLILASVLRAAATARAAADLAAIAAAGALVAGDASPCLHAAQSAARNNALLRTCEVFDDDSVQVRVERPWLSSVAWLGHQTVEAQARAGPQSETVQ